MIGILDAYHFDTTPGNYQEAYIPMLKSYLGQVVPNKQIKSYCVAQNEFPKAIDECEGWIITGSACSCYEKIPWISWLLDFIREAHSHKASLLGICFGHQAIAHALGGEVSKSDQGWGIGVRTFDVLHYETWMTPQLEHNRCSLIFSHQDQVMKLPEGASLLATDSFCQNQMYSMGSHIFSIQGHPEFSVEFAKGRYLARVDSIGEKQVKAALDSFQTPADNHIVGTWIKNFLN